MGVAGLGDGAVNVDYRWAGGHYLLWLEPASAGEASIQRVLRAMWSHPALQGCYESTQKEFDEQERLSPLDHRFALEDSRYGLGTLGNGAQVLLRSQLQRIDGEPDSVWLATPMASLGSAYPVGAYPFEDGTDLSWRDAVDSWLIEIAQRVHEAQPIGLGLIGFEANDLIMSRDESFTVPSERWATYLVPRGNQFEVFPCNTGFPITFPARQGDGPQE